MKTYYSPAAHVESLQTQLRQASLRAAAAEGLLRKICQNLPNPWTNKNPWCPVIQFSNIRGLWTWWKLNR